MGDRWLTPGEVARERGIAPDKVRGWIVAGELSAVNLATRPTGRPRWAISPEALAAFDRRRSSVLQVKTPTPRRRRRQAVDVVEFFS